MCIDKEMGAGLVNSRLQKWYLGRELYWVWTLECNLRKLNASINAVMSRKERRETNYSYLITSLKGMDKLSPHGCLD